MKSLDEHMLVTVYLQKDTYYAYYMNLPTAFKYSPKLSEEIISNFPVRAIFVAELI